MINRNILKEIENGVSSRPVTLIAGARQVGKLNLALMSESKGFSNIIWIKRKSN